MRNAKLWKGMVIIMKKTKMVRVKWSKRCIITALFTVIVLGFTACGSSSMDKGSSAFTNGASPQAAAGEMEYMTDDVDYGYDTHAEAYSVKQDGSSAVNTAQSSDNAEYAAFYEDRKLIRTVNLDMETKEFDSLLASIEQQVNSLGGYIESLNTYNGSRYTTNEAVRYSNMTVRIPKNQLNGFVNAVSEAANVISRSENVQDVTLAYVDMEGKRNSLKTEQERLLVMLEQADNLEDMLTLEDRLSTVRYQLESMESQLRTYDNKVDFATVYMSINEVKELTPIEVEEETVGERIVNGFMDSLGNVGEGFVNIFVFVAVNSPYLVIMAAVVIIAIVIVRLIDRSSKKRQEKNKKRQENNE